MHDVVLDNYGFLLLGTVVLCIGCEYVSTWSVCFKIKKYKTTLSWQASYLNF